MCDCSLSLNTYLQAEAENSSVWAMRNIILHRYGFFWFLAPWYKCSDWLTYLMTRRATNLHGHLIRVHDPALFNATDHIIITSPRVSWIHPSTCSVSRCNNKYNQLNKLSICWNIHDKLTPSLVGQDNVIVRYNALDKIIFNLNWMWLRNSFLA